MNWSKLNKVFFFWHFKCEWNTREIAVEFRIEHYISTFNILFALLIYWIKFSIQKYKINKLKWYYVVCMKLKNTFYSNYRIIKIRASIKIALIAVEMSNAFNIIQHLERVSY